MRIILAIICLFTVTVITPISVTSVECPDKESYCPEGTTCCALDESTYGCCPMKNAVCCVDHLHCCPENTICHVDVGTCEQKNGLTTPMRAKSASSKKSGVRHRSRFIASPTVKHAKPLDLPEDSEEMEPMATDTRYRTHHTNYRSTDEDDTEGRINQFIPAENLSSFKRVIGIDDENDGDDSNSDNDKPVQCPDHETLCPPSTTCCALDAAGGKFGCCPSPQATCCDDHIHCCPHGYACDTEAATCLHANTGAKTHLLKKSKSVKLVRKPAVETKTAWLACAATDESQQEDSNEDGTAATACPSGSTCCSDEDGGSSFCCPHTDGICCAGSRECCPGGFRCLTTGRCYAFGVKSLGESTKVSFFSRISATPSQHIAQPTTLTQREDATICADGSACAPQSTCCAVLDAITDRVSSYRCCELTRAVCCGASADFCCPRGYKCANERRCERGVSFLDFIN